MARNQRIFYACQAVIITPVANVPSQNYLVKGLQSIGMSSTFTLDQVFETGQLAIYENIEDIADIEVTLEKVIDGYKLIWDLTSGGLCKSTLAGASKARCDVYLGIFDDGLDNASGVPRNICWNSGMYTSSVSYSYTVDGSATESVTLVGNDRFWNSGANPTADTATNIWLNTGGTDITGPHFDGGDAPLSGVVRRINVDMVGSTLPAVVESQLGDDAVGLGGNFHIQSVTVSTDFGQENIMELGRFSPYTRYATFPIEVTCEFEVMCTSGDLINVSGNGTNLTNNTIIIKDTAGTVLDLGTKNKLTSVSYSGADTGGGNATVSYAFANFNVLSADGGKYAVSP